MRSLRTLLVLVLSSLSAAAYPGAYQPEPMRPMHYEDPWDDDNDELWLLAAAGVVAGVTFAATV